MRSFSVATYIAELGVYTLIVYMYLIVGSRLMLLPLPRSPMYVPLTVGGLTITILPEEPVVREGDTAQLVCIATGTDYYPTPLHIYRLLPNTFTYLQITTFTYTYRTLLSVVYMKPQDII